MSAEPQATAALLAWADTVDATYRQLATQAPLPDPPSNPYAVAEWWRNEVSDVDKRRYVTERPDLVAGLDGLPATVRDEANRILLDRAIANLEREEAQAWRIPSEAPVHHATALNERRDQLIMLRDRLGDDDYLLGFEDTGDGRAIVARGNPDTAANVGTFVPGTKSGFGELRLLMDQTSHMYDSANRGGERNSAVIMWIGYDAPNTLVDAASESYAVEANHTLDRFQQGLDAANRDAHLTLVGHSYGSTVIGHAAQDGLLPVDDIVAVGSPGMGVDTAAQLTAKLNISPEDVWVIEHNQDVVADIGQLGGPLGQDPSEVTFGANQLPADTGGVRPSSVWEYDLSPAAHLGYFWNTPENRQSAENIGDIIANRDPSHG